MADEVGLKTVFERLHHCVARLDNAWGYWDVAPLLRQLAEENSRLSDWGN